MKSIYLSLVSFGIIINIGLAQTMNQYCSTPPFVGGEHTVVIPNVLIVQDMTGSMNFWANDTCMSHTLTPYDTNKIYYGYANPFYWYDTVKVGDRLFYKKGSPGWISGNRINWWHMTRIDIARKALTGGKGNAYNKKDTLIFEEPYYKVNAAYSGFYCTGIITTDSTERTKGIIRTIADQDNNYIWDAGAPHFALMMFSTVSFHCRVIVPFGNSLKSFLDTLELKSPTGSTWVGDAIFEAIHYLRYCEPHFSNYSNYAWDQSWVATSKDPWYEVVGSDTVAVSCRPTFCIVIGDGGSNEDRREIDFADCDHLPHAPSPYGAAHDAFWNYDFDDDWADSNGIDPWDDCNGPSPFHDRPGDDYAYYGHINDLRPDNDPLYGIPGKQSITFYSIYLFAQGEDNNADSILFRKIAKHGGFVDLNKDKKPGPDSAEWDSRPPYGRPDNFFYADEGYGLDSALTRIFIDISVLSRVTSASAATISSSGVHGGGLAYQAQFYPKMTAGGDTLTWVGSAQALWLDRFGYLHEDTDSNNRLHLKNDWVVDMFFDSVTTATKAHRYQDTIGTGIESLFVAKGDVPVESLSFIWNAAQLLWNRAYFGRTVYTMTSITWSGERFLPANNQIDKHLMINNSTAARCDSLINFILGCDYPSNSVYRSRIMNNKVWKLGDIIYSSPTVVAEPREAFHQIYGDDSYYAFWDQYKNRPSMVYVGANDGMIHAFNGGIYNPLENPFEIAELQNGPSGQAPGTELWAFVPYNLLPHLKWLADTTYCHVYYNDLRPYATDARIFTADAVHPQGWGTLLICGQRFGGGHIPVFYPFQPPPGTQYRSSYIAFDVTNSCQTTPTVLWCFNDDNLGFTLCIPTLIKVQSTWFLVFGSGPLTFYGESVQKAYLYVLNPLTGARLRKIQIPDNGSSITNIFGVDLGLDYSVDLLYFGTNDNAGGGKIYRINTHQNTNPASWTLHRVIDLNKPITSEGSVAIDDYGKLWLYFGAGKYYSSVDIANQDTMCFVGIKDDTSSVSLNDLLDVSHVEVFKDSVSVFGTWDNLLAMVGNKAGWIRKLDSLPGERVVTAPAVLGGAVIFTSFIPRDTAGAVPEADLCITSGGTQGGNLWALFYTTGTAYRTPMLGEDANGRRLTHTPIIGDIPSEPVMHISMEKDKVFIQTSGGLVGYETPLPYDPRGGVMLWRGR